MQLDLNNFFYLKDFAHRALFNDLVNIWDVFFKLENYLRQTDLKKVKSQSFDKECYFENPECIYIGKNTTIEPFSYIKGPCIIGNNCQIRQGAYIRANVITGDNCVIGHCTEVKNSILLDNVQAAHFAYVGDSILGNNVHLGAGVKLANFRLDKNEVSFFIKDQRIFTKLKKLGAIIGDNSQIGCNSVLNPATFFEKDVICYANANASGWVLKKSIIKPAKTVIIKKFDKILKNEFSKSYK